MKDDRRLLTMGLSLLLLFSAACRLSALVATPTPEPPTYTPTATITHTPTPTATWTPEPTATPPPPLCDQSALNELGAFRQLPLPEHLEEGAPMDDGETFDASKYLTVLTHLSMQQGYVLDYVYFTSWTSGWPRLYARPESSLRYQTYDEFYEATGVTLGSESRWDYLDRVQTDGAPEGFYELLVLRIMGGQFYLHWHAHYNDTQVVCDSARLDEILTELRTCAPGDDVGCLSEDAKTQAQEIQVQPVVEFGTDTVTVQVVTFTKWGGFEQRTCTIQQSFPHTFLDCSATELVPYNCGIVI